VLGNVYNSIFPIELGLPGPVNISEEGVVDTNAVC
jgi:hypothetical protein